MAAPSNSWANGLLVVSRVLIATAALIAAVYMGRLVGVVDAQKHERDCRFDLTTETDKADSDIVVQQARVFAAAILRPAAPGERTEEVVRLGQQLETLINDRDEAYERRAQAAKECDA